MAGKPEQREREVEAIATARLHAAHKIWRAQYPQNPEMPAEQMSHLVAVATLMETIELRLSIDELRRKFGA